MNTYNEEINFILSNFDFNKVHRVMTFLEWIWAPHYRIPNLDELKLAAEKLIRNSLNEGNRLNSLSCGGFTVNTEVVDGRAYIDLGFQITSFDNCE